MTLRLRNRLRRVLRGGNGRSGIFTYILIYTLLIGIGFVYVYPLIYMIANSLMTPADLVDPTVGWLPTEVYWGNFARAVQVLDYGKSLLTSVLASLIPAVLQTISTAFIAYGLARFAFPLKKLWFVFLVASFIIPVQVTLIPNYVWFKTHLLTGNLLSTMLPAIFGQGIKSPLFILIFYQFYISYPKALDEAAAIDGAGRFRTFVRIAIPMTASSVLVTFLFSFIWYWNETTRAGMFFEGKIQTLPLQLQNFVDSYSKLFPVNEFSTVNRLNESIRLAGTLLTIAPLLILYIILQRKFIEGIERTGMTGE